MPLLSTIGSQILLFFFHVSDVDNAKLQGSDAQGAKVPTDQKPSDGDQKQQKAAEDPSSDTAQRFKEDASKGADAGSVS